MQTDSHIIKLADLVGYLYKFRLHIVESQKTAQQVVPQNGKRFRVLHNSTK